MKQQPPMFRAVVANAFALMTLIDAFILSAEIASGMQGKPDVDRKTFMRVALTPGVCVPKIKMLLVQLREQLTTLGYEDGGQAALLDLMNAAVDEAAMRALADGSMEAAIDQLAAGLPGAPTS